MSAVGRELAARAVRERDQSRVVAALVAVAREAGDGERRSDMPDGLIEMPHPLRSAAKQGADIERLVEGALAELAGRPAESSVRLPLGRTATRSRRCRPSSRPTPTDSRPGGRRSP